MATISIKFLGGMQTITGKTSVQISIDSDSQVKDLSDHLQSLGFDPESSDTIVVLNGRGLGQWAPDRRIQDGDELIVFPSISGG